MLNLRIGGKWTQELGLGKVGDLEFSHTYSSTGGGLNYVKWTLALPKNYWHPVLTEGTKVELFAGTLKLGSVLMSEPDRRNWSFTGDGLYKRAETTRTATTNLASAALLVPGWNGSGNLPTGVVSAQAEARSESMTVADVLNAYCTAYALRWGLDANDVPYVTGDPITPTWALNPGVPLMATADDNFVNRTVVRYATATSGTEPTAWAIAVSATSPVPGGHDEFLDVSDLGVLSAGGAQTLADNHQALNASRGYTFIEGIDVAPGALTTVGSQPIEPWAAGVTIVGQRGLHHGVLSKQAGTTIGQTVQWTCGTTVYKAADNSLQMFGVDFAPRALSMLAQMTAAKQSVTTTMGLTT